MKNAVLILLASVMAFGIVACSAPTTSQTTQSDKPRITQPAVGQSDQATLVDGNTDLCLSALPVTAVE